MNHLTDDELERLLTSYGQLTPSVPFTYRKKAILQGRRMAILAVAALLTLLLLAMTAGIAAHFASPGSNGTHGGAPILPSATTAGQAEPSVTTDRAPTTTPPTTDLRPPATTTPAITDPPKQPETQPPVLSPLLPAWYKGSNVQLVNVIESKTLSFQPVQLEEHYNDFAFFDLNIGSYTYSILSGDLIQIQGIPADHRESYCRGFYLRLSDGELICLGHELKDLWETVGLDYASLSSLSVRYTTEDGERYIIAPANSSGSLGYFIYDRRAKILRKIEFDCQNSDSISYSPDGNFVVVAKARKNNQDLDDLWLIDLSDMEAKQICAVYDTFGMSYFSTDERFIYTYLRIGDSVEKNEYGEWVMYDTQTRFTFRGKGQILYLQSGILVSRTQDGFLIYDCTTGDAPDDLSSLPRVIDADQKSQRYTLTIYNPVTGQVEATIADVGAYDLSDDQQYLFYYVDKADGVVMADLFGGESVTLPVSNALLEGVNPDVGKAIYRMKVSADGSKIALGYKISVEEYMDQKQREIDELRNAIWNGFLKTNNIPDFWSKFSPVKEQYAHLVEWTGYYIHDDFAIYMIAYHNNGYSLSRSVGVYHVVEDYRSGTYTLYNASENPYLLGNLVARSAWEDKVQTFRRTLKGDYDTTCALLPTLGELHEFYFDYAKCYDANGKWSDNLKNAHQYSYEFISTHYVRADIGYSAEELESVLRIIGKYTVNRISLSSLTVRRVAQINLYGPSRTLLYCGDVYISSTGKYYLQNTYGGSHFISTGSQITAEEYETLMQANGGFLVETGLYKDPRLASVADSVFEVYNDFLVNGFLPQIYGTEEIDKALSMIREGGYETDVILRTLYPDPAKRFYLTLLSEYKIPFDCSIRHANGVELIQITITDGVITCSDPSATAQ